MASSRSTLAIIVLAQFCCTSLWFAGNGVMDDLVKHFGFERNALGLLTSAVQFGFITGTLVSAIFNIPDRYSPSKVFLASAIMSSLFNILVIWDGNVLASMLTFRFFTGFFLAGIYPVGMKIASDHFGPKLGTALGFLLGALVIGTAFPHLLRSITGVVAWKPVLISTSLLAIAGGACMILLVPDGPYRMPGVNVKLSSFFRVFKNAELRSSAFGYFGHMWELYAFWAFVPVMIHTYNSIHPLANLNVPLLSFSVIGIGGVSCVLGGYVSKTTGPKRTAFVALLVSCVCCLLSPFIFLLELKLFFIAYLLIWGTFVIPDSPMFSTMVAQNAPSELRGTALTIVNSIGFFITIISILLLSEVHQITNTNSIYSILALGPILGLIALLKKR